MLVHTVFWAWATTDKWAAKYVAAHTGGDDTPWLVSRRGVETWLRSLALPADQRAELLRNHLDPAFDLATHPTGIQDNRNKRRGVKAETGSSTTKDSPATPRTNDDTPTAPNTTQIPPALAELMKQLRAPKGCTIAIRGWRS